MKLFILFSMLLCCSLFGCATNTPSGYTAADEEDEYEGRLFSWEFEVATEKPADNSANATDAKPTQTTSNDSNSQKSRNPRPVIYRAEDDSEGDSGFIIHSGKDDAED